MILRTIPIEPNIIPILEKFFLPFFKLIAPKTIPNVPHIIDTYDMQAVTIETIPKINDAVLSF